MSHTYQGMRAVMRALKYIDTRIDWESVRPYQRVIYALYLLGGIWAVITGLPGPVDMALGHAASHVWVCLIVGAPLATFSGIAAERASAKCSSVRLAAYILQISGDAGVTFASWAFGAALSSTIYAGEATFAAWVIGGLGFCALALMIRGVHKLRSGMVEARKVMGDNE